jgi:hypothetical protein
MDAISAFRPQRAVSARALARGMSHILNEMSETGHAVAVVRYGRIEAVLAPLDDGPKVGIARSWRADLPPREEEIDLTQLDLGDFDKEIFDLIARSPSGLWSPNSRIDGRTVSEILVACSSLEMLGLTERFGASFQLTRKGKRVLELL